MNDLKFGADTPEIADEVLDNIERAKRPSPGFIIGWTAAAVVYVIAFGFAMLALSAAIYGVYRMARWIVGWF
jgi:hypothetical protein